MYYVYMLRCKDNSIYTGITTDLERRMREHFSKNEKCAKYTMHHSAIKLEMAWQTENRKFASKLEYNIKRLTKLQKEELINKRKCLHDVFNERIEIDKYICVM